jgi:sensor histidine kinase YesM
MYGDRVWNEWKIWMVTWIMITTIGTVTFLTHSQYEYFVERKFPSLSQTGYRIFYKLLETIFILTPAVLLIFFLFHVFHILGYRFRIENIKYGFLVGLWINLTFGALFEVDYILNKYKETAAEKELLEKLHLDQEFEQLKQKVNPHFLFNCFNTLSSLITEDKNKAEQFLDELSKVYRYLLRNNADGMSTLENEMKFIESYFKLLKTRYGEAVHLQSEIDLDYSNYLLPSLSLQMLVENVVKHNELSKNKPLTIEIVTKQNNQLLVRNNLQRRATAAPGNKIGLLNIMAKYDLLKQTGFEVMEADHHFVVVLPLISNGKKEIIS